MRKFILFILIGVFGICLFGCKKDEPVDVPDDNPEEKDEFGKVDLNNLDYDSDVVVSVNMYQESIYADGVYIIIDTTFEYYIHGNIVQNKTVKYGNGVYFDKKKAAASIDVERTINNYESKKDSYEIYEDTDQYFKAIGYNDKLIQSDIYYEYKPEDEAYLMYMALGDEYKIGSVNPCKSRKEFLNEAVIIDSGKQEIKFVDSIDHLKWNGTIYKNITSTASGMNNFEGYFKNDKLYKLVVSTELKDKTGAKGGSKTITVDCEYKNVDVVLPEIKEK